MIDPRDLPQIGPSTPGAVYDHERGWHVPEYDDSLQPATRFYSTSRSEQRRKWLEEPCRTGSELRMAVFEDLVKEYKNTSGLRFEMLPYHPDQQAGWFKISRMVGGTADPVGTPGWRQVAYARVVVLCEGLQAFTCEDLTVDYKLLTNEHDVHTYRWNQIPEKAAVEIVEWFINEQPHRV